MGISPAVTEPRIMACSPATQYSATAARELRSVLVELSTWGERHARGASADHP
jgi:DNA-binding HxlR family transcriptional regulator